MYAVRFQWSRYAKNMRFLTYGREFNAGSRDVSFSSESGKLGFWNSFLLNRVYSNNCWVRQKYEPKNNGVKNIKQLARSQPVG